jgi:glycosyltransferase involved in cell wall biosynthesis
MKVSVCIVTYNQAKFIGKAIESALSQQTNFDFEILIGDDCSNDGTQDIIRDYQARYPDKIIPILQTKNLGQNGLFNTNETYAHARGKYIAAFDGDDYWTDPLKLQKQVDFLDANPGFSTCFHNALITYEDGSPAQLLNAPDQKTEYTTEDLIGEDEIWFMATSSVMFWNVIKAYPKWFLQSVSGDIPRYVLFSTYGKIGYLPDVMSVYRKNQNGTSFTDKEDDAKFLWNRINLYKGINQELNYQYNAPLRKNIARYFYKMLSAKQYRDTYWPKMNIALKYLTYGKPSAAQRTEVIRDHIIPPFVLKIYSFFALSLYRLKEKM